MNIMKILRKIKVIRNMLAGLEHQEPELSELTVATYSFLLRNQVLLATRISTFYIS